jgi:hypothetical protein
VENRLAVPKFYLLHWKWKKTKTKPWQKHSERIDPTSLCLKISGPMLRFQNNFRRKNRRKYWGSLLKLLLWLNHLFLRKTPIISPKSGKIAENCDHNIDPSLGEISPLGRLNI